MGLARPCTTSAAHASAAILNLVDARLQLFERVLAREIDDRLALTHWNETRGTEADLARAVNDDLLLFVEEQWSRRTVSCRSFPSLRSPNCTVLIVRTSPRSCVAAGHTWSAFRVLVSDRVSFSAVLQVPAVEARPRHSGL